MNTTTQPPLVRRAYPVALLMILSSAWISPRQALAQLPGSLVVSIGCPASGSTVSGTTTVCANVSVVGLLVVGVQFKLDGANLGAEDTSSPYSVRWNTTTTSNGSHTLTAVARDFVGLRYTSDPVTVTVFNDITPPTVAITAPASGSTVAGTITVSADASDNVGVVAVRFKLDGADPGVEDTVAPYSISWDTTTTSNGSHTLTAVARDAAGNQATSAPVTVMVSNGSPPPPTLTRFEDTDPSVTYTTTGWTRDSTSRPWSDGTAAVSTTAGAQATFTFTGTSVTWIGFRGPQAGIARVFIDGALAANVDAYAAAEQVQAILYTSRTLAAGSHTLMVEVTGNKNPSATDVLVVVDAFDVASSSPPPATGTRFEQSSATFTGNWDTANTARAWSGGTAAVSREAGSLATFTFTGTAVKWIGFRGPQAGIARVFMDGVLVAIVDAYAPAEEIEAVNFTSGALDPGSHTLEIEVTGLTNGTIAYITVDAFDVVS